MKRDSTNEDLRQEFNEWARAGRGDGMERGHKPVGEQALAQLDLYRGAKALDLGCGNGWAARWMAGSEENVIAIGVDVSDEMIEVASRQQDGSHPVYYCVASADRLPFQSGWFSHCFSMESLYYYPNIENALREVRRVLTTGGQFCAVVDLFEENRPTHFWVKKLNVPVHVLSESSYVSLLEDAGFRGVRSGRLIDPTPVDDDFNSTYFESRDAYLEYREQGSLFIMGRVA
jgi:ubiquinone/menaquinone biosynthesis C-methylase UbiE